MPTVQQLLNDVRTRLPSSTATFTDGVVIGWMHDTQQEIWRYMASTECYEIDTIAGQALYNLPSNCAIDKIQKVMVSNSTTIDGTESYATYEFAGIDEELSGSQYYDALGQIGLYPVPSSDDGGGYKVKIYYEAEPVALSTDTLTTIPSINVEYQDILKFRALRDIAGSGPNPDDSLRNYYDLQYKELLKRIRTDYYKRKAKNPKESYRRSESWWNG